MPDEIDWSVTTFAGNRRRQHEEFLALSFREKVVRLAPPLVVEPAECRRALEILGDVLGRGAA